MYFVLEARAQFAKESFPGGPPQTKSYQYQGPNPLYD